MKRIVIGVCAATLLLSGCSGVMERIRGDNTGGYVGGPRRAPSYNPEGEQAGQQRPDPERAGYETAPQVGAHSAAREQKGMLDQIFGARSYKEEERKSPMLNYAAEQEIKSGGLTSTAAPVSDVSMGEYTPTPPPSLPPAPVSVTTADHYPALGAVPPAPAAAPAAPKKENWFGSLLSDRDDSEKKSQAMQGSASAPLPPSQPPVQANPAPAPMISLPEMPPAQPAPIMGNVQEPMEPIILTPPAVPVPTAVISSTPPTDIAPLPEVSGVPEAAPMTLTAPADPITLTPPSEARAKHRLLPESRYASRRAAASSAR